MAALLFSLVAGWLLQRLGFRREIRPETTTVGGECCAGTAGGVVVAPPSCGGVSETSGSQACTLELTTQEAAVTGCDGRARGKPDLRGIRQETWADFRRVLPYLILGVAIGSLIYGFVPSGLLEQYAGAQSPWSVPVAAVIGIPLYLRAEASFPLPACLSHRCGRVFRCGSRGSGLWRSVHGLGFGRCPWTLGRCLGLQSDGFLRDRATGCCRRGWIGHALLDRPARSWATTPSGF